MNPFDALFQAAKGNMPKTVTPAIPVQYHVNPTPEPAQTSNGFFSMFNQLKNSANPEGLMRMFAMRNPQVKQVMDMVEQNGGDAQGLFYKLCKEKNVDPETILKQLR